MVQNISVYHKWEILKLLMHLKDIFLIPMINKKQQVDNSTCCFHYILITCSLAGPTPNIVTLQPQMRSSSRM